MRVLALLLLAYMFNFLDRQILAILEVPIKAELGLTDTQLGLMGGIAFASLYSTLAIPFARYADRGQPGRGDRRRRSPYGAASPPCAAGADSFWQLFLARMGVGVGEAGGVAPSYALIADYFPPAQSRPGAGRFLAWNSDRLGDRPLFRRLDRHRARLALGVHSDRASPAFRSRSAGGC